MSRVDAEPLGAARPQRFRDDLAHGEVRGVLLDATMMALRGALPLALRVLSVPRALSLLQAATPRASRRRATIAIARAESVACRLGVANTCLYRAMSRWAALRNAGADAVFMMGVLGESPGVGHAWVEVAGIPVDEVLDARLVVTYRFGSPR